MLKIRFSFPRPLSSLLKAGEKKEHNNSSLEFQERRELRKFKRERNNLHEERILRVESKSSDRY